MRRAISLTLILALPTIPGSVPVVGGVVTVAQSAEAAEAAIDLDRPTRRVIQRGLRNEGFDPGTPDGFSAQSKGTV